MGGSMPRPGSTFFANIDNSRHHKAAMSTPQNLEDELDMVPLKLTTKLPDIELRRCTTFEPFTRLPFELRRVIWLLSLPSPQLLEFHVFDAPRDLPWNHVVTQNPTRFIPKSLHVCHESRQIALTSGINGMEMAQQIDYKVMPRLRRNNKACKLEGLLAKDNIFRFWDPKKDAFYLKNSPYDSASCGTRSRCYRNYTQSQFWFDPRLRHIVLSECDMIYNIPAWLCRMPELETIIVISRAWQRANLSHWRGKKAHMKANSCYRQDEELIKERLDFVAGAFGKKHLSRVRILAVEDEREASEEVRLSFPGLCDKVEEFRFFLVEGETIPRRVRK